MLVGNLKLKRIKIRVLPTNAVDQLVRTSVRLAEVLGFIPSECQILDHSITLFSASLAKCLMDQLQLRFA